MSARNTASILQMLASGLQGGMEGYQLGQQWNEQARQRQIQDRQIRQQDEDRAHQLQQNRLSLLSKLAEGQRSGTWDADFSKQAWGQAGYDPMTQTIQQPRQEYVGQVEAARKDPKMLGPMPAVKGFKTVYDPKEVSIFDTITQAPKLVTVGGSLVDANTGKVVYQGAPKPETPQRPVIIPPGSVAIDPKTGKPIAEGKPKTFAPPRPTQPRLVTAPDGTLVPAAPGVKVRVPGSKPATAKPQTDEQLRKEADFSVPPLTDRDKRKPDVVQARHAQVKAKYEELKRKRDGGGSALTPAQQAIIDALRPGGK